MQSPGSPCMLMDTLARTQHATKVRCQRSSSSCCVPYPPHARAPPLAGKLPDCNPAPPLQCSIACIELHRRGARAHRARVLVSLVALESCAPHPLRGTHTARLTQP